jgi:L-ribulose-5-phosphate 4-epimerase
MLEELKQRVWKCNVELLRWGLVVWTGGNVSGRDPQSGLVVIKPSGVLYDELKPEDLVVVDLDGQVLEGSRGPSTDTASHLYVYRHRPDVFGVTHTHSNYATAFAAVGRPIPAYITGISDEFGREIPCGEYARIGGEAIGEEIVRSIGQSKAILMKQHGVFTIGASPEQALKAAVMVEDSAKTVWLALQIGQPQVLPQEEIDANYDRYSNRYGQK